MTEFRWGQWIGGLILTLFVGVIADFFAMLGGAFTNMLVLGAVVGIVLGWKVARKLEE